MSKLHEAQQEAVRAIIAARDSVLAALARMREEERQELAQLEALAAAMGL